MNCTLPYVLISRRLRVASLLAYLFIYTEECHPHQMSKWMVYFIVVLITVKEHRSFLFCIKGFFFFYFLFTFFTFLLIFFTFYLKKKLLFLLKKKTFYFKNVFTLLFFTLKKIYFFFLLFLLLSRVCISSFSLRTRAYIAFMGERENGR